MTIQKLSLLPSSKFTLQEEISHILKVEDSLKEYIKAATSDNTRRAYQSDIHHFQQWGGKLPATPESILFYLHAYAPLLHPFTLRRRLTAIKHWHTYQGFPDPTTPITIRKTLAGIIRLYGKPKNKASPFEPELLLKISACLKAEGSPKSLRDKALLQIGFLGAFRRSELVAIAVEHIHWDKKGIEILIPTSKTDQTHQGQYCALPYGKDPLCPIHSLKEWLAISGISEGKIFRRLSKKDQVMGTGLSPASVNLILKKRVDPFGITTMKKLSSHSLRRGLASSASEMGATIPEIMQQGRWKNVNTVMEYIESTKRFSENAALHILKNIKNF